MLVVVVKRAFAVPKKFRFTVISIGNITAGGTGKTPLVMEVARRLISNGKNVAIASSGLGSKRLDEISMMHRNLPTVTLVGKSEKELETLEKISDIVILDDGFHCHRIKKDINLLVLDASNPFDNNLLIPSGLLREPRRFIKEADALILTHTYMVNPADVEKLHRYLTRFNKPVFVMDYEIGCLKNVHGEIAPETICNTRIVAFAGIGNPLNFFHILLKLSPGKIYGIIYPDHFWYREKDINELCYVYLTKKPDYIITTEKDYVKLEGRYQSEQLPLFYMEIKPVLKSSTGAEKSFDTLLLSMLK